MLEYKHNLYAQRHIDNISIPFYTVLYYEMEDGSDDISSISHVHVKQSTASLNQIL